MKKRNNLLFIGGLILASCNNNGGTMNQPADTTASKMENAGTNTNDNSVSSKDADFVKDVIKSNDKELHLIGLAEQKAGRKDIKDVAMHMETDHKKLGDQMSNYASQHNISVGVDSSDLKSDLDDKSKGSDWDKAWVNTLVDGHKKTIDKFESAETNVSDSTLKTMIVNTLPTLRSHYDMLEHIKDKMKE